MRNKLFLAVLSCLILFASCTTCKRVARHPECFPPDTVHFIEHIVHYEKEYITEDSLIYDSIPCDPVEEKAVFVETVYKTINKTIIDTIYKDKKVMKLNPINASLQADCDKLDRKLVKSNVWKRTFGIASGIMLLIIGIGIWLKLKSII